MPDKRELTVFDSYPDGVKVIANDYSYEGYVVSQFKKRSGAIRVVVEDCNGRLFIHNPSQLRALNEG